MGFSGPTAALPRIKIGGGRMRALAQTRMMKRRIESTAALIVIGFVALSAQVFRIQVCNHSHYCQLAHRYRWVDQQIPPVRGSICDRNGHLLAQSLPVQSVCANPSQVVDPPATAQALAPVLQISEQELVALLMQKRRSVCLKQDVDDATQNAVSHLNLEGIRLVLEPQESTGSNGSSKSRPTVSVRAYPREIRNPGDVARRLAPVLDVPAEKIEMLLNSKSRFVWLRRHVDSATAKAVEQLGLPGIGLVPEMRRHYPLRQLAANLIGHTNIDGVGMDGLERQLDKTLAGTPGRLKAEVDALRNVIPGTRCERVEPVDGHRIVLTIDTYIQHLVETAIQKVQEVYRARSVCAVVLDPRSGEILAMATRPTYDPNCPAKSEPDERRNRCVTDIYEPGSTLKSITVAAALEEGVITPNSVFTCAGTYTIGKRRIRCVLHGPYQNGHGTQTIRGILRESCNIGAAQIGMRLGARALYRYIADFGFIGDTSAGLIGEQRGLLDPPDQWLRIRLANVAFGQGVSVTPLQLAVAYAAIANGGRLMQPYFILREEDASGKLLRQHHPRVVRQVISPDTAHLLTECLKEVVAEGTGKPARIPGYVVAGKTGSAQKVQVVAGKPVYKDYVASFVGYAPADNPRVVALVVVDEPKGSHWGATCAAPAFREIVQGALWYLKVPPDRPAEWQQSGGSPS